MDFGVTERELAAELAAMERELGRARELIAAGERRVEEGEKLIADGRELLVRAEGARDMARHLLGKVQQASHLLGKVQQARSAAARDDVEAGPAAVGTNGPME